MAKTLTDLLFEARQRRDNENLEGALKVYRLVLEAIPLDFDLRFEIADLLATKGDTGDATAIYQAIATHDIKAGNPLRALVAIKILEMGNFGIAPLIDTLIGHYAKDAPTLGRGVRPAPIDRGLAVRADINLDYPMDQNQVQAGLVQMAAYLENITRYPSVVPPIPIFSTLEPHPFGELLCLLTLERHREQTVIIKEGSVGDELYFIARGIVRVEKVINGQTVQLARLGAGSIFGEMALVSDDPRGASVIADEPVDLLALTKPQVEAISQRINVIGGAMRRFTRDRMITNLLATNPLFKPFDEESKKQLLSRFVGHEIPKGTIFIEQGKPGNGLYLIMRGEVTVLTWNGTEYVQVATLGPGDVAGEISLIHEEPANATVQAKTNTMLLFLAKELFYPLIEAVPELFTYFAKLANKRISDTKQKLAEERLFCGNGIEEVDDDDDIEDLDADDLVMV